MMFRLGAIMTVAAAASPWDSAETSEEGNYSESRQLGRRRKLTATVKAAAGEEPFHATVTAEKKRGKVVWKVKIDRDDIECDAYNWHIHARPVAGTGDCGATQTGGHTDNSHMCGGATEEKQECQKLYGCDTTDPEDKCYADQYGAGKRRCNVQSDLADNVWGGRKELAQRSCEYGDLSGKMGKIQVNTADTQKFEDYHLEPLRTYRRMSVVLHCCTTEGCKPRIACGDFKYR